VILMVGLVDLNHRHQEVRNPSRVIPDAPHDPSREHGSQPNSRINGPACIAR
jgi:hypothetical protein